jgi:hypothetical protein
MISRCLLIGLIAAFAASTSGCMGVASPVLGALITDDVHWDGTANGKLGTKEGEACAQSYFAVYATGDASIKAAAAAGGITNVMSVDHRSKWLLVFGEYCTIVRGS